MVPLPFTSLLTLNYIQHLQVCDPLKFPTPPSGYSINTVEFTPSFTFYVPALWPELERQWWRKHFTSASGFPCGSDGKESACNEGELALILGLRRSPGEGKGCPLQYSGLENSMDCIVHGVTKSQTWLSDFHFTSPSSQVMRKNVSHIFSFLKNSTLNFIFPVIY